MLRMTRPLLGRVGSHGQLYGFMPAKGTIFNDKCRPVHELGSGPWNTIAWSPMRCSPFYTPTHGVRYAEFVDFRVYVYYIIRDVIVYILLLYHIIW